MQTDARIKITRTQRGTSLTPREKQVWDLREQGYSYLNIGTILGIEESTVKGMMHRLLQKSGCNSTSELAYKLRTPIPVETRIRELNLERAELTGRLAIIHEQLTLLGGAPDEEKLPVLDFGFDFAARAGIASILADYASGRADDVVYDCHAQRECQPAGHQ